MLRPARRLDRRQSPLRVLLESARGRLRAEDAQPDRRGAAGPRRYDAGSARPPGALRPAGADRLELSDLPLGADAALQRDGVRRPGREWPRLLPRDPSVDARAPPGR